MSQMMSASNDVLMTSLTWMLKVRMI